MVLRMEDEGKVEELVAETAETLTRTLVVSNESWEDSNKEKDFILGGKLLKRWPTRAKGTREVLEKIWRCQRPWKVKEVKTGFYEFRFSLKEDMEKVIRGRPWTVKGAQLILVPWPPDLLIEEINFKISPFVGDSEEYHRHTRQNMEQ